MIWCSHMTPGKVIECHGKQEGALAFHMDSWSYCPICGKPRPKEQTLAEKLKLASVDWDSHDWGTEYWDILAKTAEDHFKESR